MSTNRLGFGAALIALVALTGSAAATTYYEVYPFTTLTDLDATITNHQIATSEGNTGYSICRAGSISQIVKISDLGGTPTASSLTTTSGWGAGIDYILPGNTLAFVGNDLMFSDTRSDQIYKVDKTTGAMSVYLQKATLVGTYGTTTGINVSNGVTSAGEFVFQEFASKDLVVTTGVNTFTTLVTSADLTTYTGSTSISGGLTYDGSGNLYWGNTTSDSMYIRSSGGTISTVLDTAQITAVTGGSAVGFGDIFYAPDGLIYFRDTSSKSILSFDPANPVGTLATVLTEAELIAGPATVATVDPFSWYDGLNGLAFATIGSGGKGYYALPEPATLGLLALGGLALVRRRSH